MFSSARARSWLAFLGVLRLASGAAENRDRLTCLRQDNLDLVIPSMNNTFRMVIPINEADSSHDLFVSIASIDVRKISATLTIKRGPGGTFKIDMFGDEKFKSGNEEYDDVAVADLMLTGLGLFTQHSLIAMGAQVLPGHTAAQLFFKLSVEGRAVYNDTTAEWELEFLDKGRPKPFEFKLKSESFLDARAVIQNVLNEYVSIDELIINQAILPGIKAAMPRSVAPAFQFLSHDEFGPEVRVQLLGEMTAPGQPLRLTASVALSTRLVPVAILKVFREHFDPRAIAEQKLGDLFELEDIDTLLSDNKAKLATLLARYGVPADVVEQGLDKDTLQRHLLNYTRASADWLVTAMQPLIDGYKDGQPNPFAGYELSLAAKAAWDELYNDGLTTAHVSGPESPGEPQAMLVVPVSPLAVPHARGEETVIRHEGLRFQGGSVLMSHCQVKDFRMVANDGNGTRKTYNFGTALRNLRVQLPQSWDPHWEAEWNQARITISKDGTVSVTSHGEGIKLQQVRGAQATPVDPEATAAKPLLGDGARSGAEGTLEGRVPAELQRPTQDSDGLELFPRADIRAATELRSGDKDVIIKVTATANGTLSIEQNLRRVLAPRPVQDFGYPFAAEFVKRMVARKEKSGKFTIEHSGTTAAIVSCGYLRLLEPGRLAEKSDEPLRRIAMGGGSRTVAGQYQIDLSGYAAAPDVYDTPDATRCMRLNSNGHQPRERYVGVFSSNDVVYDELCGPPERIMRLKAAIDLQITRFRADRDLSQKWNYGTHPTGATQYLLGPGRETRGLMDILRDRRAEFLEDAGRAGSEDMETMHSEGFREGVDSPGSDDEDTRDPGVDSAGSDDEDTTDPEDERFQDMSFGSSPLGHIMA